MKRLLKWTLNIAMIFSFTTVIAKQNGGGGSRENLTDEQEQCMESILGKRGEGERPSREAHEAAKKQCNISESSDQKHGPPPGLENLTDEQASCLHSKLGKPGEGHRPSRDDFQAATAECGIVVPDLPGEQD